MKKVLVLLLMFHSCIGGIQAQNKMTDSLASELKNHTHDDTTKVMLLNALSAHVSGSQPEMAKGYAEQALALAQSLNYRRGIADAYLWISQYYKTQANSDRCMHFALLALKEYVQCNIAKGITASYRMIGASYNLAMDFDKSLRYYRLSLALDKKAGDQTEIGRDLISIGVIKEITRDYDSALYYARKGLELFEANGADKVDIIRAYNNVGSAYTFLGNYAVGLEYFFKALPLAQRDNYKDWIALLNQNIGEVYFRTGKYREGEAYLKECLRLARELGNNRRKEQVYDVLRLMEESRKNYRAAYQYLQSLLFLRDTLLAEARVRRLIELETLYETEKKEQTIRLLEQEKRIDTIWRNALVCGVLLASVAAFLIYKLQRSRTHKTKQLLKVQQLLNDKLKDVDKLKSGFFANISHEFRTPLTLILAPLDEALKKQSLATAEKEQLQLMKRNANRLLELVNQLLDLSKLEAGKMELQVKQGNVVSLIKVIAASFDSWAQHKQIRFIKNILVSQQLQWYDHDKVEKIITNLLSNAFKFTPAGGKVTLIVTEKDPGILSIIVSDTGKGIPEDEQDQIFLSFYQARQTIEGHQGGTGLGLSLVKELVKLYGGAITLQSAVGVGTTFSVALPSSRESFLPGQISAAEPEAPYTYYLPVNVKDHEASREDHAQADVPLQDGRDSILIAEDNADLRGFMHAILERDFTVFTARDGEEAMQLAMRLVPSLVLSDLMMPKVDGLQLTEKLRAEELTSHIPVILLTARNEAQSRLHGLKTGADDYLTKPFSTEELLARIRNLIEQRKLLAERFRERILVPATPSHDSSLDDRFLQKVREIVEVHMSDFSFTVEKMAEEINLSRTQLLRKLKALTGLSPNEFIKDLRLKKAADMIRQKADTITQVGYAVGFNDQSYFTKCFKKQFGITPTDYSVQSQENQRSYS